MVRAAHGGTWRHAPDQRLIRLSRDSRAWRLPSEGRDSPLLRAAAVSTARRRRADMSRICDRIGARVCPHGPARLNDRLSLPSGERRSRLLRYQVPTAKAQRIVTCRGDGRRPSEHALRIRCGGPAAGEQHDMVRLRERACEARALQASGAKWIRAGWRERKRAGVSGSGQA